MTPAEQMQAISARSGGTASQTFGELTRRMWMEYLSGTVPFENRLIDYSSDPRMVSDAMTDASTDARRAFANRAAAQQRQLRSAGLTLSAEEQAAADRATNLAASLADVNAQNTARDTTLARQRSILGSPVPTIPTIPAR